MPIKYIIVPEPIKLLDPLSKEVLTDEKGDEAKPVTFADFLAKQLFTPMWGENYKNAKSARAIERACEASNGVIQLAEEDWKKLRDALDSPTETPKYGFHPAVVRQLLPFIDAVMDAKDTAPEK